MEGKEENVEKDEEEVSFMPADAKRWRELKEKEEILKKAAAAIRVQEKDLPRVMVRFKREIAEMDKKLK